MSPGRPLGVLLGFSPPFSLIFLSPEGNRIVGTKKGNKVLEREMNRKLVRGARFLGTWFYFPEAEITVISSD